MMARRLPDRVRSRAVVATEGKVMTSFTSGTLVYWNSHTGFGQIELDSEQGHIDIYRTDLLRAGHLVARIGRLASGAGRCRTTAPFLTLGSLPCRSKRKRRVALTSPSSGTG